MKPLMKTVLSVSLMTAWALLVGTQAAKAQPPSNANTIAEYSFENGTVGGVATTIVDTSGSGNNGTALGAPVYNSSVPVNPIPQTGASDQVSLGMGPGDGAVFNYPFPFDTYPNATLEFYINPSSISIEQDLFWATTGSGDTNRFSIVLSAGGSVLLDYRDPSGNIDSVVGTAAGAIQAGQWNFVAIVKSGTTYSIYVNNLAPATGIATDPNLPTSTGWTINGRDIYQPLSCCQYSGLIDDVRLSNQALTPSQFLNAAAATLTSGSTCNGVYGGIFNGNVNVSAGQNCVFVGGGVTGNVQQQGGNVTLIHSLVGGNVQVNGGGTFTIGPGTTIKGNLQIQNIPSGSIQDQVCGSTVDGDLQFQSNGAPVEIGSTTPASCAGNTVGGNLTIQNNTAAVSAVGNTVGNNLTVQNNTAATMVDRNTVKGNLQDQSNMGPTQVSGNLVGNNLQCQNNTSITGGGNTAGRTQGQCADLTGVIYDLSSGWSNSQNPNGPWSYNQGATPLPLPPNYTFNNTAPWPSYCNQPVWAPSNSAGNYLPAFLQLNACAAAGLAAWSGPTPQPNALAGDVIVHTVDGHNGSLPLGVANVLFTFPASAAAGAYTISGSLWDAVLNTTGYSRPQDWFLLLNGTRIASGYLDGFVSRSQAQTIGVVESLNVDDRLELQIVMDPASVGANGYFVGIRLTITQGVTL